MKLEETRQHLRELASAENAAVNEFRDTGYPDCAERSMKNWQALERAIALIDVTLTIDNDEVRTQI